MRKMVIKIGITALFLGMMLGLTACNSTELEERCFPMVIGVGYEEDTDKISFEASFPKLENENFGEALLKAFQEAKTEGVSFSESVSNYETRLNKSMDYNHLKVLVLEDDLVEERVKYDEVLTYLAESELFPRNTYVCIVDDFDDFIELEKNLSQDLGTYLEEYFNTRAENGKMVVTLGDLIDEKENKELTLLVPFLEVGDYFVEWQRNYTISE